MATSNDSDLTRNFLEQARYSLAEHHLPRIIRCLKLLSDEDIWWRPNRRSSNSIGNLVLHLSGNVNQWIFSGLGDAPYTREREKEFREQGPLPRHELMNRLRTSVREAARGIVGLNRQHLKAERAIQGFRVTGFQAISHASEHFAYHCGQIVFITKLRSGEDLRFTRLPDEKRKSTKLPVL